ncbi:MAG: flagellum-specific ATP synthase FliI, partial [Acetobacteraceae bacterium]
MRQTRLRERATVAAGAMRRIPPARLEGGVGALSGLLVEVAGLAGQLSVGDRLDLVGRAGGSVPAEVVGFRAGTACAMAFGSLDGLGPGSPARAGVP